jgi:hypothetical protein
MKKYFFIAISLMFLCSCANRVIDVKSPCVSSKHGPCGPKKPINDWWLNNNSQQQIS